ncbi:MAG: hypothetical protein Ct9H300mP8_11000 [Gammaproteobacteria bacterium]|nr:MAG: hypothetical protein Ct9H300mP8_11000 [Gammaproteobacteria bacterium]
MRVTNSKWRIRTANVLVLSLRHPNLFCHPVGRRMVNELPMFHLRQVDRRSLFRNLGVTFDNGSLLIRVSTVHRLFRRMGASWRWCCRGMEIPKYIRWKSRFLGAALTGDAPRIGHRYGTSLDPDGKSLIFTSDRGGRPQIYRVDLRTSLTERLTYQGDYNARARLLPDGRHLVYVHRREGVYHIAWQDLETDQGPGC